MTTARSKTSAVRTRDEQRTVELDHPVLKRVDVKVRRNRRSRHVRLHVDEHGAISASVPQRFAAYRLDAIVRERAQWLYDVLVRMELKLRDTEVSVEHGDPIRYLGRWIPVKLSRGGYRPNITLEDDNRLIMRVPDNIDVHDTLIAWYRRTARALFEQKVDIWAEAIGVRPGKVSIRNQKTRWGSCTFEGDLSFNWRLILAPEWVLDSIVVHELCHIDELNHSEAFWALLDQRYPKHKLASEWLSEHGSALRVTRPSTRRFIPDSNHLQKMRLLEGQDEVAGFSPSLERSKGGKCEQFALFED